MKVLITGALGHIGSALVSSLAESVSSLILVDNLSTQRFPSCFNIQIRHQFYSLDISDEANNPLLAKLVQRVDTVIHLAARTDAAGSVNDPVEVERNNFLSTRNIALICKEENIPLVHISSTSVYGTQSKLVDENCAIQDLQPQSPYARSKLKEEQLLTDLGKEGLRYKILRFGTIFGFSIGMRFHTAVNKFVWQAAHGEEITIWKTALHQVRPYLYLSDAVTFLQILIENARYTNNITNVVTANLTVNEIIDQLKKYYPNLRLKFVDSPIMNQLSYDVCNKKSLDLGMVYKGNIHSGIKEIVLAFKYLKNEF